MPTQGTWGSQDSVSPLTHYLQPVSISYVCSTFMSVACLCVCYFPPLPAFRPPPSLLSAAITAVPATWFKWCPLNSRQMKSSPLWHTLSFMIGRCFPLQPGLWPLFSYNALAPAALNYLQSFDVLYSLSALYISDTLPSILMPPLLCHVILVPTFLQLISKSAAPGSVFHFILSCSLTSTLRKAVWAILARDYAL